MRRILTDFVADDTIRGRALRSSAILIAGFGAANLIRLVSNLILTRLLFPEAFGLIALVYVFLTGLAMFSDLGINVSIIQNKRGDDPVFLNTAWSLQIIRGVILWIAACALAYPAAQIYDEPELAMLLPAVGLTAIIQGFATTRIALANRNLQIGVQVTTELLSQIIALIVTAFSAWATGSVWSIVAGALAGALTKVISQHLLIKGPSNRWIFEPIMIKEIFHFGKYIFLGSICGFIINQGDRAILGFYVPLSDLGIFAVAFIFSNLSIEINRAAGGQIIFPLYAKFPPIDNPQNRNKVLKARRILLFSTVSMTGLMSIASIPVIDFLYDSRYHDAGPILALLGFTVTTQIAASNYDGAYLASGNSKQHFKLIAIQAVIQIMISLLLISRFGVLGAIIALGLTTLIAYPFRARVANQYGAWDPKTDLITLVVGWGCGILALYLWRAEVLDPNTWI